MRALISKCLALGRGFVITTNEVEGSKPRFQGDYQAIEVHRREGNFWRPYHYRSGDLVELTSIGVSFPFDALYRRIPM